MALDFFAGCLGGCAGVLVGHPLDTVKVHLQTQNALNPKYRGTFHCLRSIISKNGVLGIYRGISSPLAGVAGINAIVFGVYGNTQRQLPDSDALRTHFLAGCLAGLAQSPICSPMELVKTRLQLAGGNGRQGAFECLKQIYATGGYRGVFKGLGVTVSREIPAFGTYFLTYELLTRTEDGKPISTPYMLLAGGLAGTTSWIISYPMDVIKSRLQADGLNGPSKYNGAMDCLRKSIAREGFKCLSKGLTSTIIRAFPTNAACFTVVTWTFRLSGHQEDVKSEETLHSAGHEHEKHMHWFGSTDNLRLCEVNRQGAIPATC